MKKRVVNKQKIFIFVSIVFIVFCICFYGFRFVYYYKKFHKKSDTGEVIQLLSSTIRSNNEPVTSGDGLYSIGNEYIFKGQDINNYVLYSGLVWRIVKINNDNSITLVTEELMNEFMWGVNGDTYKTSQVKKWLNSNGDNTGIFYKNLYNPDNYLKPTTVCMDAVSSLTNFKCDKTSNEDFVSLLNTADYTNSISNGQTYLNIGDEYWLSTTVDSENVWYVDSDKISKSLITDAYGIKPVITLNSIVGYESGSGKIDDPYIIGYNSGLTIGNYVKIDNDMWIIYEVNTDSIRLVLDGYMGNNASIYKFGNDNNFMPTTQNTLAYHLNNEFYESLAYKDILISNDWYIGEYNNDFTNIYSNKVNAKVGLYNIADIKLHSDNKNYYLITKGKENKVFSFDMSGYLFESVPTQNRMLKPAITIKKNKVVSGTGIATDPYVLER